MRCSLACVILTAVLLAESIECSGQISAVLAPPLVQHPVASPVTVPTAKAWRSSLGAWGESLTDQTLRLQGYDVMEIKSPGNQGFDRVAVKRGPGGVLVDARIVEVKTHRGSKARLNKTRHSGRQMSWKWMTDRLRDMRRSGAPAVKELASEISRFTKQKGIPLTSIGEIHDINTRTGRFTRFAADNVSELSSESVEHYLSRIQKRASSPSARGWATRSLSEWDQIRACPMTTWQELSGKTSRSSILRKLRLRRASGVTALAKNGQRALLKRVATRAAGPVGFLLAVAFDAKDAYDLEMSYSAGKISLRERQIGRTRITGGATVAFAGGAAGAYAGGWIGTFGGPFAPVTIPLGVIIGGGVGGAIGYMGGSVAGEYAATAWYDSIDNEIQERFEAEFLSMTSPTN